MSDTENPASVTSTSDRELAEWGDPNAIELVKYWSKCEDVAMHFNDLLMNFRLKALGGLALAAGLATGFLKKSTLTQDDWRMFGGALALTTVVWASVAMLDLHYYMLLLQGAVDELRRVEGLFKKIQLSTKIEEVVQNAGWKRLVRYDRRPARLVAGMYAMPGIMLAALTTYCLCRGSTVQDLAVPKMSVVEAPVPAVNRPSASIVPAVAADSGSD